MRIEEFIWTQKNEISTTLGIKWLIVKLSNLFMYNNYEEN